MIIDSKVTQLLEASRALQQIVASSKNTSLAEKIKANEILKQAEEAIEKITGTRVIPKNEGITQAYSSCELNHKLTAAAYDINNAHRLLNSLPAALKLDIKFIRLCSANRLVRNKFTMKDGIVRAEFGNDKEVFCIVQHEDGSYASTAESNLQTFTDETKT